jgi:hypothetical protein
MRSALRTRIGLCEYRVAQKSLDFLMNFTAESSFFPYEIAIGVIRSHPIFTLLVNLLNLIQP